MPIQILPEQSGIGRGLSEGMSALSQALGKRKERTYETQKLEKQQARQAESGNILQSVLGGLGPDASFQQVQGALAQALQQGADPTIVNQFAQQYGSVFKEQAKPKTATAVSPFEKTLQQEGAKKYVSLQEDLAGLQGAQEDIDRMKQLTSELSGLTGSGKALWRGETATEFENLGAAGLDKIIKIFNPAGVLPKSKLDWIKKTFAPKAWERTGKIKGKLAVQERMFKHAQETATKMGELYEKYKGPPPMSELLKIDAEAEKMIDNLKEETDGKGFAKTENKNSKEQTFNMIAPNGRKLENVPRDKVKGFLAEGAELA